MFSREVRILKHIKSSYAFFEQDSLPSIHLVVRTCHCLFKAVVTQVPGDPKVIVRLQQLLAEGLADKVVQHLTIYHYQAAILCPSLRDDVASYFEFDDALVLSQHVRQKLLDARKLYEEAIVALEQRLKDTVIKVFLKKEGINDIERQNQVASAQGRKDQQQQPEVRKKADVDPFALDFDDDEPEQPADYLKELREAALQELHKYLKHKFTKTERKDFYRNPFKFWCPRNAYPTLSIIARNILTIPSNSSAVERIFSASEELLSARRMSMAADTVGAVMRQRKGKPGFV